MLQADLRRRQPACVCRLLRFTSIPQSLIWVEVALHLPFFFVACSAFHRRRNWIRLPALIYGAAVSTSMVPILTELALGGAVEGATRLKLLAIYLPYLVVPLMLVATMVRYELPFGQPPKGKRA
jgi:EXPERA (EXPanded EBP superfamily)